MIVRRGKHFLKTHVMFADACCIIKRRSSVLLRFDPRSVHELGHSITLPRLDDRCFQHKIYMTVQQQEVLQEDVEMKDV